MVAAVISSASESEPLSIAAQQRLARRVARLVPTKLVQCDLGLTPTGAFCVGTFAAPKAYQPRPAAVALAEAERARRVAAHGTRPVVSPTLQAVGAELPRNLVSCDLALTACGAFATRSTVPSSKVLLKTAVQSGLARLLDDDDDAPSVALLPKAASIASFDAFPPKPPADAPPQLSSSPTSVTASASVGDLRALAAC